MTHTTCQTTINTQSLMTQTTETISTTNGEIYKFGAPFVVYLIKMENTTLKADLACTFHNQFPSVIFLNHFHPAEALFQPDELKN